MGRICGVRAGKSSAMLHCGIGGRARGGGAGRGARAMNRIRGIAPVRLAGGLVRRLMGAGLSPTPMTEVEDPGAGRWLD